MSADVDDGVPEQPLDALFAEAVALRQAGRWEDAGRRFDAVLAALEEDSEGHRAIALRASYLKIVCLHEQGDAPGTIAACNAMLESFRADDDPRAVGFLADTLWLKSRALARRGDVNQERLVLRQLIGQYADEPLARDQVARAMYNEGIHLRESGHPDEAIQAWDELFSRFTAEPPKTDPFIPIRAQLAKSHLLAETSRLDAALVTCERMLDQCTRLGLPEARVAEVRRTALQCTAMARRSRGFGGRLRSLITRS